MTTRLMMVNGSLRGSAGNTHALLELARGMLSESVSSECVVLADYRGSVEELANRLAESSALLFASGVYWSSWGSPLQRFLEVMTGYELTPCFLGKPAGVLLSADSLAGAEVAHRLQGVLTHLGCWSPPLSSVVLTRVASELRGRAGFEDVFQTDDIRVALENLCTAAEASPPTWSTWGIARTPQVTGPFPQGGPLLAGLPRFVK
ncbi:MAG: NAD(P)H-dependent oxidoreductase [Polyangiaceae bacterium]